MANLVIYQGLGELEPRSFSIGICSPVGEAIYGEMAAWIRKLGLCVNTYNKEEKKHRYPLTYDQFFKEKKVEPLFFPILGTSLIPPHSGDEIVPIPTEEYFQKRFQMSIGQAKAAVQRFNPENKREAFQIEEMKQQVLLSVSNILSSPLRIVDGDEDRLFLHVLGDIFGLGTGLEGLEGITPLRFINMAFEYGLLEGELGNTLATQGVIQNLKEKLALADKIYFTFNKPENSLQDLSDILKESFNNLKTGGSFFFPGGWIGSKGGHAIYYEVSKQENGKATFTIINTGAGIDNHAYYIENGRKVIVAAKQIKDIDPEKLFSDSILIALRELETKKFIDWDADDIYDVILPQLGSEVRKEHIQLKDWFAPQYSGTCSYRSLMAFLSQYLPDYKVFNRIDFKLKLKVLSDFLKGNRDQNIYENEKTVRLIEKSITYFAQEIHELHQHQIINDNELQTTTKLLQMIRQEVEKAKINGAKLFVESNHHIDLTIPENSGRLIYSKRPYLRRDFSIKDSNEFNVIPRNYIDWKSMELNSNNLSRDIQKFISHIQERFEQNDYSQVLIGIKELTDRISFGNSEVGTLEAIISRFSSKDLEELSRSLRQLAFSYYSSLGHVSKNDLSFVYALDPRYFFYQMKLLGLMECVFNQYFSLKGAKPQNLFPQSIQEILIRKNGYMQLFDPNLDEQFLDLQGYFQRTRLVEGQAKAGFFDFNDNPEMQTFSSSLKYAFNFPSSPGEYPKYLDWEYLKTDEFQDRFYEVHGVSFKSLDYQDQIISTFSSNALGSLIHHLRSWFNGVDDKLFPSVFYDARDVATLSHLFIERPIKGLEKGESALRLRYIYRKPDSQYQIRDVYFNLFHNLQDIDIFGDLDSLDQDKFGVLSPHALFSATRRNVPNWIVYSRRNYRLGRYENGHHCPSFYSGLDRGRISYQAYQDVHRLYLEKNLQVNNVLGFFYQQTHLLEQEEYRAVFEQLLFEPGLLIQELKSSKVTKDKLIHKFQEVVDIGIDYFQKQSKWDSVRFLLLQKMRFNNYVTYVDPNFKIQSELPYLQSILENAPLSDKERSDFHALRVFELIGQTDQSIEKVKQLFESYFYMAFLMPTDEKDALKIYIKEAIKIWVPLVVDYQKNNPTDFNKWMNQLIKKIYHLEGDFSWNVFESEPYFVNEEKELLFNLETGEILEKASAIVKPPVSLLKNREFIQLFPDYSNFTFVRKNLDVYEMINYKTGYRFRVDNSKHYLSIYSQIDGKWYQLKDNERGTLYLSWDWDNNHHQMIPPYFSDPRLYAFSEDNTEIIGLETKTFKPLFKITFLEKYTEITELDEKGKETGYVYLDLRDNRLNNLSFLSRLDHRDQVVTWHKGSEKDSIRIDYPRLNLQFQQKKNSEKEVRLSSLNYKGFFLDPYQYIQGIHDYEHAVVLRNEQGKLMALFPDLDFIGGSLVTKFHVIFERLHKYGKEQQETVPVYKFYLDPQTREIDFSKINLEQRLFLIKVYLMEQDYEKVSELIRPLFSSTRAFSPAEHAQLGSIFRLSKLGDHDPKALTYRLKSIALRLKNHKDFPDNSEVNPYDFSKHLDEQLVLLRLLALRQVYTNYLNLRPNLLSFHLEEEEELVILDALNPVHNLQTISRLERLDPAHYQEALSLLAMQDKGDIDPSWSSEKTYNNLFNFSGGEKEAFFKFFEERGSSEESKNDWNLLRLQSLNRQEFYHLFNLARGNFQPNHLEFAKHTLGFLPETLNNPGILKENLRLMFNMMFLSLQKSKNDQLKGLVKVLYAFNQKPETFVDVGEALEDWDDYLPKHHLSFVAEEVFSDLREKYTQNLPEKKKFELPKLSFERKTRSLSALDNIDLCIYLDPTKKGLDLYREVTKPLQKAFAVVSLSQEDNLSYELTHMLHSSNEPLIEKEKQHVLQTLQLASDGKASHVQYTIENGEGFLTDLSNLYDYHKSLSSQLKHMEISLLKEANKPFSDIVEESRRLLEEIGTQRYPITMNELKLLFLEQDARGYYERNPALSFEDSANLHQNIMQYLLLKTEQQHLERILKTSEKWIQSGMKQSSLKDQQVLKNLYQIISQERQYSPYEHPEYLVFEEAMGIMLYQEQVANLDHLRIQRGKIGNNQALGTVLEMMVGSGKTYVLAPLLGKMVADGEKLSVIVLPEALFPSMSQDLTKSLGKAFRQYVQSFQFDRQTKLSSRDLEWIYYELQQARHDKKVVMLTSESIQSLYLLFIENLYDLTLFHDNYNDNWKKVELFKKIFTLFKNQGSVLIDEIDTVLHPLHEHHFTLDKIGPDAQLIKQVGQIYRLIQLHPRLKQNSLKLSSEGFSPEIYHEQLKPILIDAYLDTSFKFQDPTLKKFLQDPRTKLNLVRDYLSNSSNQKAFIYVDSLDSSTQMRLALAKEMIHSLLPLTLSKSHAEHFGRSKTEPHYEIAIPYHGSNHPAEGSRFGTTYESLNYTYQLYLSKKISLEQLQPVISSLKAQVLKELRQNPRKAIESCKGYQMFQELTGHKLPAQIFFESEYHYQKILKVINDAPENIILFTEQFILPKMEIYSKHIQTGPQLFGWLFHKVQGFTGTLWNYDTFPNVMEALPSDAASGKILSAIFAKSQGDVTVIKNTQDLQEQVQKILLQGDFSNHQAIIDAGGYFRGIPNEEIAKAILTHPLLAKASPEIQAVVFYNEQNELKLIYRKNGVLEVIDYEKGLFPEEQTKTFYDQKHTTGSDIPQSLDAKGVITIGPHVKVRDLIQSAGRMRKLTELQRVGFVLTQEVDMLIRAKIKKYFPDTDLSGDLNAEHILLFSIINQAIEIGNNNYRALKSKAHSLVEFKIADKLVSEETSIEDTVYLFRKTRDNFVLEDKDDPYQQFGHRYIFTDKEEVLDDYIANFLKTHYVQNPKKLLPQAFAHTSFEEPLIREKNRMLRIVPEKLLKTDKDIYQKEVQIQVEAEKEQEKEEEIETEVKRRTLDRKNCYNMKRVEWKESFSVHDPFPMISPEIANQENPDFLVQVPINQVLAEDERLKFLSLDQQSLFDSRLSATRDVLPFEVNPKVRKSMGSGLPFKLFDNNMRHPNYALIVEDEDGQLQFIMLDEANAAVLKELDAENICKPGRANPLVKPYKIALYQLDLGYFLKEGESPEFIIDSESLKQNPEFISLKVQMKFLNGYVDYEEEEIAALKQWLSDKDIDEVELLFTQYILSFRDENQQIYSFSILKQVFDDLRQKKLKLHYS